MGEKIIYLDTGATTSVRPEVIQAMLPYFNKYYGNPSSPHELGEQAHRALLKARTELAQSIGAKPWEIIFTSGGTESNNLAIFGLANSNTSKNKIIISSIEHSSVWDACSALKNKGYSVIEIPVNREGFVDIKTLESAIDRKTLLVSIIHGHNEIGVLQDIKKIGAICKLKGACFHTDAVQSFGKEKIDIREMHINMLSASGHKIKGPKGTGLLFVKEDLKLEPIIIGGAQEKGLRGGTENIPGIIGFAKAVEISKKTERDKIRKIRDYFMHNLERIGAKINGSKIERLYDNINASFPGMYAEHLVLALSQRGIMCSTRSACLSKQQKENRVLKALGLNKEEMQGSLRFGLDESITKKDVDFVVNQILKVIKEN